MHFRNGLGFWAPWEVRTAVNRRGWRSSRSIPGELLRIPLEALRDEDANGVFDRLEPGKGFLITGAERDGASLQLTRQVQEARSKVRWRPMNRWHTRQTCWQ